MCFTSPVLVNASALSHACGQSCMFVDSLYTVSQKPDPCDILISEIICVLTFSFFLSLIGRYMLLSHASAEACLTGWPNVHPRYVTSVGVA